MLECQEGGGTLRLRKKAKKKVPIGGVPMAGSMELGDNVELLAGRTTDETDRHSIESGLETPGTPKTPSMNPQNRQLLNELHFAFEKKAKDSPQNERRQPDLIPGDSPPPLEEPYFPKPSDLKKRPSMQDSVTSIEEDGKPKPKIVKRKPQTHLDSDEEAEKPRPPVMVPKRKSSSSSDQGRNRNASTSSDPLLSPHEDEPYEDVRIQPVRTSPAKPVRMVPVKAPVPVPVRSPTSPQGSNGPNSPTYHKQRTPTTPKSPLQEFTMQSPTGSLGSPSEKPHIPIKPKHTSDNGKKQVPSPTRQDNEYENVPKLPAKTSKRRSVPPPPPPPPVEEYMEPVVCRESSPSNCTPQNCSIDTQHEMDSNGSHHMAPDLLHDVMVKDNIATDDATLQQQQHQDDGLYEDVGFAAQSDTQMETESLELDVENEDEDVSLSDMIHNEENQGLEDDDIEGASCDATNGIVHHPYMKHNHDLEEGDDSAYVDEGMDGDSIDCLSTTANGGQSGDELQDENDMEESIADSVEYPPGYDHADFTLAQLNEDDELDLTGAMLQNGMNGSQYEDDNIYEDVEAPPLPRSIRGPAAINGHGRRSLEIIDPVRHLDDASYRRSYHGEDPKRKLRMEVCIPPPEDTAIAQV